ncbi:hypothetical protein G6F68_014522 [Rhizopus microsporus]|nr:hypothetical protein G6F68_014522 [Rhizopus microsporus]
MMMSYVSISSSYLGSGAFGAAATVSRPGCSVWTRAGHLALFNNAYPLSGHRHGPHAHPDLSRRGARRQSDARGRAPASDPARAQPATEELPGIPGPDPVLAHRARSGAECGRTGVAAVSATRAGCAGRLPAGHRRLARYRARRIAHRHHPGSGIPAAGRHPAIPG